VDKTRIKTEIDDIIDNMLNEYALFVLFSCPIFIDILT